MPAKRTRQASSLPVQWEELTASDFPKAVKRAKGVCLLPMGVIEKHGPHLPLGTDVMDVREAAIRAARDEYAVVFPPYYFGQINCAKHQPGCISIRPESLNELLQQVCDEIARNGFDKILLANGHGGNTHWLNFFCQVQLAERKDYVVYLAREAMDKEIAKQLEAKRKTNWGGHACEFETSVVMATRPDLVKLARAGDEDGRPRGRLKGLKDTFTAMWWYADFPDHYAGDARPANAQLGELALEGWARGLARLLRAVKSDKVTSRLQDEFYARADKPLAKAAPKKRR